MADTTTPNLGLFLPDLNDVVNFATQVEANFTVIDSLSGAVDCTSTSRPTTTYKGQIAYEHDSGRYVQNTGTGGSPTWTYMSHAAKTSTSAALPTSGLSAGMLSYLTDAGAVAYYSGTAWHSSSLIVCTSATRLTGGALQVGSQIYETDTLRQLIYNGSTWVNKAYANFITTSSTHPSSPFTGLEIFETDTGLNAVYNGSNYLYGSQQASPTQVLSATTASVTFSGIPAVNNLQIVWRAKLTTSSVTDHAMQIDGVTTGTPYQSAKLTGRSGTASVTATNTNYAPVGVIPSSTTAGYFGSGSIILSGWAQSVGFLSYGGTAASFDIAAGYWTEVYNGQYLAVGPHTSIKLSPNGASYAAGSEFSLYAIQ